MLGRIALWGLSLTAAVVSVGWLLRSGPEDEMCLAPRSIESGVIPGADLVGLDARGERMWAVGHWGALRLSTDRGAHWSAVRLPVADNLFSVSFADEQHGWIVGAGRTVLRSEDGGRRWTAQRVEIADALGEELPDVALLGVSAVSPQEAWAVGDLGTVLHTRDGVTWQQRRMSAEVFGDGNVEDRILVGVHFTDALHGWIAGEFGTLLRTEDGGETWRAVSLGLDADAEPYLFQVRGVSRTGGLPAVSTVSLEGAVWVSEDAGRRWESRATPVDVPIFSIDWAGQAAVAVGDRGTVVTTSDGGRSWQPTHTSAIGWLGAVRYGGAGPDGAQSVVVVGEGGTILYSRDGGRSFESVSLPKSSARGGHGG